MRDEEVHGGTCRHQGQGRSVCDANVNMISVQGGVNVSLYLDRCESSENSEIYMYRELISVVVRLQVINLNLSKHTT